MPRPRGWKSNLNASDVLPRFSAGLRCSSGNTHYTALPWTLWLDIVRYAREQYDPAALDAAFLAEKQRQGMSNSASFEALIAAKRDKK